MSSEQRSTLSHFQEVQLLPVREAEYVLFGCADEPRCISELKYNDDWARKRHPSSFLSRTTSYQLDICLLTKGLPWWSDGKETACQCRRRGFDPWVGKTPWRRERQSPPVFLPGESNGQRSLAGYSPRGRRESDTNE